MHVNSVRKEFRMQTIFGCSDVRQQLQLETGHNTMATSQMWWSVAFGGLALGRWWVRQCCRWPDALNAACR